MAYQYMPRRDPASFNSAIECINLMNDAVEYEVREARSARGTVHQYNLLEAV